MKAIVALCLILAISNVFALEDASAAKKTEKRGLYGGFGHFGGFHGGIHDVGYHGGYSHSFGPYHSFGGHGGYYPHSGGFGHHGYYY